MNELNGRKGSLSNDRRSSMVYIFAGSYQIAADTARAAGLGRIRWQFIASKYTLLGRRGIRIWTVPAGLTDHPQWRSVAAEISNMRAMGYLAEDKDETA